MFDLFAILWKRRLLVLGITVAAAVLSVAYAAGSILLPPGKSYLPNVYTPRALMMIDSSNSGGLSSLLSSSGLGSLAGLAGVSVRTNPNGILAEALATTNATLDSLNEKFGLTARYKVKANVRTDTRKAIKKRLTAKLDQKTNLFLISYEDTDPIIARDVVNATVNILEARFTTLGGNRALNQKTLLETKLAEVEVSIAALESDAKAFQAKYGVANVEALAVEQVTVVARLRSELILKDMAISNYQKVSRIDDPVMRRLKDEREILSSKIREIEGGKSSSPSGKVMPSQKELPDIAFDYARIQRDLLVQTEVFKLLTQQYEIAKLSASGQDPVFQILELAEAPDKKSGPARSKIVIVATMAGFFLAILLSLVLDSAGKIRNDPLMLTRLRSLGTGKEGKR